MEGIYKVAEALNVVVVAATAILVHLYPDGFGVFLTILAFAYAIHISYQTAVDIEWWRIIVAALFFYGADMFPDAFYSFLVAGGLLMTMFAISLFKSGSNEDELEIRQAVEEKYLQSIDSLKEKLTHAVSKNELDDIIQRERQKIYAECKEQFTDASREDLNREIDARIAMLRDTLAAKNAELFAAKEELAEKDREIAELHGKLMQEQDEFIKLREQFDGLVSERISNQEIHERLLLSLNTAQKELDIMSPWINRHIVNDRFLDAVENAIQRGSIIKIIYGIGNLDQNGMPIDERSMRSKEIVDEMHRRFGTRSLRTKFVNSHSKLFLCDDLFYIITSCNPLSHDGQQWGEIGEVSKNVENLLEYRKKYFGF